MDSDNMECFFDEFECGDEAAPAESGSIDKSYLNCLKTVFGHSNFRAMQWKIISSVMNEKRDNFTVMATGYGKSLCYQFPSVYLNTVTIVVSPLISLMEDQVLSLTMSSIKACLLGTAQKNKSVINEVLDFQYNLVYLTPEFITGDFGTEFLKKLSPRLTLIAIDEAHCISEWGHDFRSAFRSLGIIRRIVPNIPILAMTATATEKVRQDIIKSLNLRNPQELCTGFDRPNLEFHVQQKSKFGVWSDLGVVIRSVRVGSIIVYCLTRAITEEISEILNNHNIQSTAYHAGLSLTERKRVHEQFVRDKIQVIVATVAFGMGIDKPDVRMVIHYGASKDLESYYQEVGRAGRDGMPAKCVMFYSTSDWRIHEMLTISSAGSQNIKKYRKEQALKIKEYVGILSCRRAFIISYFEDKAANIAKSLSNCCDNCKNNALTSDEKLSEKYEELDDDGFFNFTTDSENFFKAIEMFNGYKGLSAIVMLLRGCRRQTLGEKYYSNALFGIGKDHSEIWWKSFATLMEINGYTSKKSFEPFRGSKSKYQQYMSTLVLTEKARNWLQNPKRDKILLKPDKTMYKSLKQKKSTFLYSSNNSNTQSENIPKLINLEAKKPVDDFNVLLKALLLVRANIAKSFDCMPYMIISNKALHQLAQKRPSTLEEIKNAKLDGLSEIKLMKFGPVFIKTIAQFSQQQPNNSYKPLKEYIMECPMSFAKPLTETLLQTYELYKEGKNIKEIAIIKNIVESTTYSYHCELIKHGLISTRADLRKLGVADHYFNMISTELPTNLETVALKDIKSKLPTSITYDMIKLVLSYHQLKKHCEKNNIPFADSYKNVPNENQTNNFENILQPKQNIIHNNVKPILNEFHVNKMQKDSQIAENRSTEETHNTLWDSNDDDNDEIDFGYLDRQVEIFNNSNLSMQSTSSATVQSSLPSQPDDSCKKTIAMEFNWSQGNNRNETIVSNIDGEKELDLLIDDIRNDAKNCLANSQESLTDNSMKWEITEDHLKSTKRKMNFNQKNAVVYLDDSSSSEDDNANQKSHLADKKKKYPNWLVNVK